MLKFETLKYNDKLYRIYRTFKEKNIKEDFIAEIKEYFNCDLALRNHTDGPLGRENYIIFLREITDLDIID